MKVLLADLDGTLITTVSGKQFPEHCMDMQFKPGILDALKKYTPDYIGIVTNQGGVEKGFVPKDGFAAKINLVEVTLSNILGNIRVLYEVCYNNDPEDPMRKPNPGMIDHILHRIEAISSESIDSVLMIGDMESDRLAAQGAAIPYKDVNEFIEQA